MFDGGQGNLFVYVGNDPVEFVDPPGLWGFAIGIGGGAGLGFPLGFGGEAGVGVAFDYTPGQGFTAANYTSVAAHAGAGFFGGFGVDFSAFQNIEDFAGVAFEAKVDLGVLDSGGIDVGKPLAGKANFSGVTTSWGLGLGLFLDGGMSATNLDGVRITPCGDTVTYSR